LKAMVFEKIGGPLVYREAPNPIPNRQEVLVSIHAASVNPADYKVRSGFYPGNQNLQLPYILGRDFSGVVTELGAGVSDFSIGDQVFGVLDAGHEGTYAEIVSEKAEIIAKKPSFMTHPEASALALTGLTAIVSLEDTANLKAGEKILIQGGAGGVGSYAVQLAKHLEAHVIVTASPNNHEYMKKLGADEVIDYNTVDFREKVSDCDVVYDTVGGDVHLHSYDVLLSGGRMVYVAPQPENFQLPRTDVEVLRPKVGRTRAHLERIIELAESSSVTAPAIEIMPLSEASAAQEKIKSRHVRGKIVLEP
jgi:NADPH:quinone reductase-like Zn-dependent oxidoreductase